MFKKNCIIIILSLVLAFSSSFAFADAADVANIKGFYSVSDQLETSGLPEASQFQAIKDNGCDAIICLIPPTSPETQPDVEAIKASGLEYYSVPFNFDEPLQTLDEFTKVMAGLEGKKVHVFCASNYRASATVYAYYAVKNGQADKHYLAPFFSLDNVIKTKNKFNDFFGAIEKQYNLELL